MPVSFDEAALGAEIKVPTLGGPPVTLRIPPGTPNGRVMRVRGRGAQRKDGTKGDLLVTLDVQVPAELDDATREAVTAYREARKGADPRAGLFEGGCVMPRRAAPQPRVPGPTAPVYVISVAAELTGLHPQTLRQYDRVGLVSPGRTGGGGRRYSLRDIELLREVAELTASGIGIEGVRRILELEHQVAALRARNTELREPGRRAAGGARADARARSRSAGPTCRTPRAVPPPPRADPAASRTGAATRRTSPAGVATAVGSSRGMRNVVPAPVPQHHDRRHRLQGEAADDARGRSGRARSHRRRS